MNIFRKKSFKKSEPSALKKELKLKDLIMLGIGACIGTGIFVVTGQAAAEYAGPALSLSFIVAAFVVILSGFSFAEFASRIPVSGGPYGYMYVVFGELSAWMAGWFLICEYLLAVSSVASGWSGYVQGFLGSVGIYLPTALTAGYNPEKGTYVDLIAAMVMIFITLWVSQEAKKALRLNNAMVWIKFAIIALFVLVGIFFVQPTNWQNFMPFGMKGVFDGAALVFFAFLGFDAISMAVDEVEEPQKNIPRGIIGSLLLVTALYSVVTLILTGIVPFDQLGISDPVAFAMRYIDKSIIGSIVSVGAIMTLLTVSISMLYSLARLVYAISKDGLLPSFLRKIDSKHRTPRNATYVVGGIALFFAAAFPMNILAELTNMTALACLIMVSGGIIQIRRKFGQPREGEFKMPWVPILPLVSIVACGFLMTRLQRVTWIVFGIATVLGLLIYFGYGYRHSHLNKEQK